MSTEMHEALNNKVHEVSGEVHEPYDDLHESKVEQAFSCESHNSVYEAQKAAAVAKRIVEGTNRAVRVEKKAAIFDHSVSRLIGYQ